jgi:putative ABC transport system permease protein
VLVGAGLLIESMVRLANAPLGYARNHLLTANIRLPESSYPKAEDWPKFWERLKAKLQSLPGVEGVTFGTSPTDYFPGTSTLTIEGEGGALRTVTAGSAESVGAGYFHVIGIPLLEGREFTAEDRAASMPVAVVNEAFVREFFPKSSPIGRRIKAGTADAKGPWLTVVGVVGNVSRPTLFMNYSHGPGIYQPLRQQPSNLGLAVFVRSAGSAKTLAPAIVRTVADVDSNVPVPTVQTMDESLSSFLAEPKFRAQLFGVFAGLALLLAAVGIYAVLSQLVAQRTHEIGIRVALGASHQDVLRLVLGEGFKLIVAGTLIGVICALALTRLLSSMLYGVRSSDPLTFAGISLFLVAVALLACYFPARRAMRMNPLLALRSE